MRHTSATKDTIVEHGETGPISETNADQYRRGREEQKLVQFMCIHKLHAIERCSNQAPCSQSAKNPDTLFRGGLVRLYRVRICLQISSYGSRSISETYCSSQSIDICVGGLRCTPVPATKFHRAQKEICPNSRAVDPSAPLHVCRGRGCFPNQ